MDLSYIPQAAYAAQDRDRDKLRDTAKISVVFFFCFYFFKVFCNSIFLHVFTVPSFLHFGKLICVAFFAALSRFCQQSRTKPQHQHIPLGQQRDDRCRYIEGEEPQDDADHEMIEERLWEQVDHQIGIRVEQPQIIGEEQLMERGPEAVEVSHDPDAQQAQK